MTDKYSQVSGPSKLSLKRYRDLHTENEEGRKLTEILKEDLYALVTSLSRRIQMEGEKYRFNRKVQHLPFSLSFGSIPK